MKILFLRLSIISTCVNLLKQSTNNQQYTIIILFRDSSRISNVQRNENNIWAGRHLYSGSNQVECQFLDFTFCFISGALRAPSLRQRESRVIQKKNFRFQIINPHYELSLNTRWFSLGEIQISSMEFNLFPKTTEVFYL